MMHDGSLPQIYPRRVTRRDVCRDRDISLLVLLPCFPPLDPIGTHRTDS